MSRTPAPIHATNSAGPKVYLVKTDYTLQQSKVWVQQACTIEIMKQQAKKKRLFVLRGNSFHSSSDSHLHHSTLIVVVGRCGETSYDLIGID